MAKTRFVQSSFVSGELSPLLKGRTDVNQYYQAVETADNVVIVPQGGMKRRPGTEYIGKAVENLDRVKGSTGITMPNGGSTTVINDVNDATTTSTTVAIGTTDPYSVVEYDFGSAVWRDFVDLRQISLSSGSSDEFKIQNSSDGITWANVKDVPLIGTSPQNIRITIETPAGELYQRQYWRLARVGSTDLSTATVTVADVNFWYEDGTSQAPKLVDFSIEDDRHYLIEFTAENIRAYRTPSTLAADIKPTYSSLSEADVQDIRVAQIENVMLIFGNFEPMRLVNLGTDDDWFLDNIPFTNIPQYDFDDDLSPTPVNEVQIMDIHHGSATWKKGERFEIDIEGVTSKSITFAGDATPDEQAATVFNIQKNLQDMPVFGETGVSVARTGAHTYTITISGESTKDFELFSAYVTEGNTGHEIEFTKVPPAGSPRKEDVWSSTRGWPRSACFYEGRLVIGGTRSKPQSIFMSKTGTFFDFEIEEADDDEAIFATISSRKMNDIVDVYPGRNLQIFTSGAEFAITSRPVTPANINIQPQTSHGASNIEVQDVDGSTMFIDRHGKSLLGFLYSFNEDAYTTDDRSVLASHLINQPVDMALLAGTASDDANWLFIVNSDGSATVLNTLRSQDINGFTSWNTDGNIKSVCVVDQELYMSVEREVNSQSLIYIERWDFNYKLDCARKDTASQIQLGSIDHLFNEQVQIIVEDKGYVLPARTVGASNQISLDSNEVYAGNYEVGLLFTPTIKPMPLNTSLYRGDSGNQMRLKKIVRMNLRVYESSGINIDGIPVAIRSFGPSTDSPLSPESIVPTSGIIEDVYDINGWGREVMPTITCPDPTPMHIQMIEYEVEGN